MSEPTQGGELKNGGNVPFIQIVMKGFKGQPIAARAEFDPDKLFKAIDAPAIIKQAMLDCVRQALTAAAQADIFMLKAPILTPGNDR